MVSETTAIKGSARGLAYQSHDKGHATEVGRNGLMGDDPKDWHRQMRAIENQYERANISKYRVSQVISLTREEAKEMKTAKDWEDLAKKHFSAKGIDLKNHAYIMHTHGSTKNPHLHVTASRITFAGKQGIAIGNIGQDFGKITDKIAKERGWNTAKETGLANRHRATQDINEVLQKEKARNLTEFSQQMEQRGYVVKPAISQAKGLYGLRIIPKEQAVNNPSPRLAKSGQGYKLSEIPRSVDKKATYRIGDLKQSFERNAFERMSTEEKLAFAKDKKERTFGPAPQASASRFDQARTKREEKKEQEQQQERPRGFRR